MVMYMGQNGQNSYYSESEIGQDDGQSEVEVTHHTEKVVCNGCGAEYTDQYSIEMTKKWVEGGYAPCPNLSCRGQLEVKEV